MTERYTVRPWTDVVKDPELPGDVAETAIVGWDVVRDVQQFRPGVVSYDLIEQFDADEEAQARDLAQRLNAAGPQPLPGHSPDCTGPDWGVCSCKPTPRCVESGPLSDIHGLVAGDARGASPRGADR